MTTDNIINLVSAIIVGGGTLFLGIMALRTIRQTRGIQKSEKRERLLNEIIEWADDIRKNSLESITPSRIRLDDPTMQIGPQMNFLRLRRTYQETKTKDTYVKAIAKVFGGNLPSVTETAISKLDEIIEILSDCLVNTEQENSEKVEAHKKSLDGYAEDLIEEATKIKTKEIT